jgi:hypothetical protein
VTQNEAIRKELNDLWYPAAVIIAVVLAAFAASMCGCAATPIDGAVTAANAAAELGTATEHVLAEGYERAQADCLAAQPIAILPCVDEVRARYRPRWAAYEAFRTAWLVAEAAIRAAQADGNGEPEALATVARLLEAQRALGAALKGTP